MPHARECPLCGAVMQLTTRHVVDRVPGTDESLARDVTEWVCPDCENYEDADSDEDDSQE